MAYYLNMETHEEREKGITPSNVNRNPQKVEQKLQEAPATAHTSPSPDSRADQKETNAKRSREVQKGDDIAKAKFYCEPCGKQYQTAMEWETHLSSYDHHHKKRWKEMNQMVTGRTKKQRLKKEQKQVTRDLDAFAEQFERARKEEQILESSKPRAEAKKMTSIQQSSTSGMVFHLKSGKKQPITQSHSTRENFKNKTSDVFGEDSDD